MKKNSIKVSNIVSWARKKSPWILHFNSGGCNGCDIEILSLLTPLYDVERFGILKESSPRHADILICTGPVTEQVKPRLQRIYDQIPEPKWVLAVGSCSCTGGIFSGSYNILGGIDKLLPVDMYIPGCPCRPETIIDGIIKLVELME
ncbi:MAG TPA: NADH-quinone oxidoreductase subunit B family protein [Anaerolineaceae bacterium]|jgi:NADH-quinone oxidoreductase B subunit|nr:NADH-quinone oxidoreductase subunit B family protein [Anaerolineaceae bacterium]